MDYRKSHAPTNTVTRDMMKLSEETGNVYESGAIISNLANQISVELKQDLEMILQEFASYNDNLEEVFENREQIEISRYYEKLPKSTLIAAQEYEDGKVYYKNPAKEKNNFYEEIFLNIGKADPQMSRPFHLKRTYYHVTKNTNCLPANYRGAYGRYLILAVGRVATRRRSLLVRC